MELNKKLAEWAGFKPYLAMGDSYYGVIFPDGETKVQDYPNFTESLDLCFKWLVPKLAKWEIGMLPNGKIYATVLANTMFEGYNDKPALALCLAIEKVIDGS